MYCCVKNVHVFNVFGITHLYDERDIICYIVASIESIPYDVTTSNGTNVLYTVFIENIVLSCS